MKLFATLLLGLTSLFALEEGDREVISSVIQGYTQAWNEQAGKGFADGFTEDGDFVNIYGMHIVGKAEIEARHVHILDTFLKGSTLEIEEVDIREVAPTVAIAHVRWKLNGYRDPFSPGETSVRQGIFTQVYLKQGERWLITASHNTLIPNG